MAQFLLILSFLGVGTFAALSGNLTTPQWILGAAGCTLLVVAIVKLVRRGVNPLGWVISGLITGVVFCFTCQWLQVADVLFFLLLLVIGFGLREPRN